MIAVGGNSLIRAGQKGTVPEQFANAQVTADSIAEFAERKYRIVITHGNGPQVGSQLLRSEAGSSQTYSVPLDVCVAMTQGEIGYILQSTIQSALRRRKINIPVVTIVTQVLVDQSDPAFGHPTKPIGPFYSREDAGRKHEELGWDVVEDAARGYRRVVPSPRPLGIVEKDVIRECLERQEVVIASGGGGIPVIAQNGNLLGIEAVIDKDRASSLLATELEVSQMVVSTDVERVYLKFKTPDQKPLCRCDVRTAKQLLADGEFLEGSMKPKIEAAVEFLEAGGREVIITDPLNLVRAVDGQTGTHITNS